MMQTATRKRNATKKNPNGQLGLTPEGNALLADLLLTMSKWEQQIELKRQYLA